MPEETPLIGEEAFDTATGRPVWWDGVGWSYTNPEKQRDFGLAPQARPQHLPLSYAQQRLWFINQLQTTSAEYNMPEAFRLIGELDIAALELAIAAIVERHEILRTHFAEVEGEPVQVIAPQLHIDFPVEDLSGLDDTSKRERVVAAIRREFDQPFDLSRGPLLRVRLLKLSERDHVLLRTFHHIIFDAWSQGVFHRELTTIYEALRTGRELPLRPLPVQYVDFTLWQRGWLNEAAIGRELEYWREQLANIPAQLDLPKDSSRPAQRRFAASYCSLSLSAEQLNGLKRLSQDNQATLYMTLLAAFAALLHRYSGQRDIVVGSPVANRRELQLEQLIGFFVNTLAMRVRVDQDGSFRDLLAMVRATALEAYQHQDLPFERLVEELSPERSLNTTPLFQVVFALQNAPAAAQPLKGLKVGPLAGDEMRIRFDLEVHAYEGAGGIDFQWVYDRDLFDRWRVEQMARHYGRLLQAVTAVSDLPLHRLEMLSAEERRALLEECNATDFPLPAAAIPDLFEAHVARTPEAVAVRYGEQSLTYAELNSRANRLARRLIDVGVGPEVLVGLAIDRSLEMMVALLAVLKAGGAYVPIAGDLPAARRSSLIADAGLSCLITTQGQSAIYVSLVQDCITLEDSGKPSEDLNREENPRVCVRPDAAAYVNYTSGSTGQPKGVLVSHASVVRLVWEQNYVRLGPSSHLLQLAPLSFDAATFEIWGALLNGGSLVVMPPGPASVEEIGRTISHHSINTLWLTAGLFHELVDSPDAMRALAGVDYLIAGGDVLSVDHVRRVLRAHPGCKLINGYGPTENTTFSCCYSAPREAELRESVPIGYPIRNTRAYVLDEKLEPVPNGVTGELYVAGAGLARGYLRQKAFTAERFVADPHDSQPGRRMYRTGDLVRRNAQGALEFLGRADHQIKIRGFRVELGEIEAVLSQVEGVQQCVVLARQERGEKRLVAYVVPVAGGSCRATDLQAALAQRLAGYMVPSDYVVLQALPLTPNGKLDRATLPRPERPSVENNYRAPRTPVEEMLCEIFAGVLAVERVGIDDNFFALGGHSLAATRLVSRIRAVLGVDVALRTLFEFPTVAELSPGLNHAEKTRNPLERQVRPERLPLSYAQQRLWFIDQLEKTSTEYNLPAALRLRGELDYKALRRAVSAIVERHESLRTHFAKVSGEPVQIIMPQLQVDLPLEDISGFDEAAKRAHVGAALQAELESPFDLTRGPLLRLKLLKAGERDHVLLYTFHHIVSDGWSQGVFHRELIVLYEAFHLDQKDPLPPLPVQYADFALWQRAWLNEAAVGRELEYWKQQLHGITAEMRLPQDRPRPPLQTFVADVSVFTLPAAQVAALKELGRASHATLYMTLLAAFAVLLERYSGQQDIVVGSPIANRQESQLEQMIGFFVNTLVMRVRVQPQETFRELLAAVRGTTLEAYQHQNLPFERLVEELSLPRSLNTTPVYQVMFALQNAPQSMQRLQDLEVEPISGGEARVRFDLEVHAWEHEGKLSFYWVYNRDLFDRWRMEQMARHYGHLLEQAAAHPVKRLWELEILAADEQKQLVEGRNQTSHDYPRDKCVHQLFEEQAIKTPNAVAAICGDQSLTYGDLNAQSNRLAHHLIALGAGPDVLVGIFLERSHEMVIGLLGILKACAAYLPLDPEYPQARLAQMLADAMPVVVLTTEALSARLPQDVNVLKLDDQNVQAGLQQAPSHDPTNADRRSALLPAHSAYVIYTSGSTGIPKGVVISHGSMVGLLSWAIAVLGPHRLSRVLASTALSFDVSVFEIFAPLLAGGRIEVVRDLLALAEHPSGMCNVSLMSGVPSAFSALVERRALAESANTVVLAGEALPPRLVEEIRAVLPHCRVANFYGPTEASVYVTAWHSEGETGQTPSIGRPIWNTRVYVLDERLQPAPVGVAGELYLAGAGLARAYLNRRSLTSERFVADPYAMEAGARMYRTGDLVRWRSDGDLQYLGRSDQQVKVRGYRIELGEIEAVLGEEKGIRQCAVVARDDRAGARRIVAYVAAAAGAALDAETLRRNLAERLPEYMLPGTFVILDALPLNANGKLDRHALPAPEFRSETYHPPITPHQEILCEIFAEVLELERAGIDDNFFTLGGHSLLAMLLVSRIQSRLGAELPVRIVFEHPTPARLSLFLGQIRTETARIPLVRQPRPERIPLSYAQQRLWFIHRLQGTSPEYNLSEALRLRGELDQQALVRAIHAIVERHETLRTRFVEIEGEPVQMVAPLLHLELPREDLSTLGEAIKGERVAAALRQETVQPFDLASGPLLRMKLLKLGEQDHVLLRTFHHIVSDAWSQSVFNREFMVLYEAFHEGRENPLKPLEVQYADFALWQRACLDDEAVGRELDFWRKQLAGIPEQLELPRDRPRPALQTFVADIYSFVLPAEQVKALKRLGQANEATLYMTLLSAFAVLLQRYSGEKDIVVGSPIANRNEPQLEQMIGFFVNTLVMRVQVKPFESFRELLQAARNSALEAYQHQDLPFERLVEELALQRSLNTTPIFQVLFAVHNAPLSTQRLKGLEIEPVAGEGHWVRFDLEVHAFEREQQTELYWMYNRDLFDRWRMEQMARQLGRLLEQAASTPDQPIGYMDLMAPEERQQVLIEWNRKERYEGEIPLHRIFEQQAERAPHAVAVVFEQRSFTYADLNRKANRLAHYLLKRGVGPEVRVGICLERSLEMVVSLLGVLKAGGAYLPLDLNYPAERLNYMLADAQAKITVMRSGIEISAATETRVVDLDRDWEEIAREDESNPVSHAASLNAAYVIYTSGSTGRPKGVVVTHQNVVRLFAATQHWFDFARADVWTLFHSYAFDFSVWELWGALLYGGRLVVVPYWVTRSPEAFYDLLKNEKVTVLNQTPSAFRQLSELEEGRGSGAGELNLRLVIFGGEALEMSSLRPWFARHGDIRPQLVNMYGITETTVHVTYKPLRMEAANSSASMIGERIPDLQIYILDELLQPAPVGVPGELYVGGAGLARGYLNRPELTAERFIPHPFSESGGERLYRTGDLARYRNDRDIEYSGRIDHQVKVRGHRIELGEIEAALSNSAGVKQCAVIAREDSSGGKQLVAYIEPVREANLDLEVLRQELGGRLPDYMMPGAFVLLETMPLTVNGKLDRRALPAPEWQGKNYRAPRTAQEEKLCELFAEVLGLERVGIEDNFFALGGHSLIAPRLVSRIRDTLGLDLTLRALFESPTVAELSLHLASGTSAQSALDQVLALRPHGSRPPIFCLHGGSGLSWGYAGLVSALNPEWPIFGLQASGIESEAALPATIGEMAQNYLKIIRRIQPRGPYHLIGMSLGGLVAHSMACRLQNENEKIGCLALLDSYPPAKDEIIDQPNIYELFELVQFDHRLLNGGRGDIGTVVEVARQSGHVLGLLEVEQVERMLRFLKYSAALRRAFQPGIFRGDMLFFAAAEDRPHVLSSAQWEHQVTGQVQVHEIQCRHARITDRENIAAIGRVLGQYLQNRAAGN